MNERDVKKARYRAFRREAIRRYGSAVSPTAEVQFTEGGAFVEARLFIPDSAIDSASVVSVDGRATRITFR